MLPFHSPFPKLPSPPPAAPAPGTGNDFARLALLPGVWVVRAEDPFAYQLGVTFRSFRITFKKDDAPVFVASHAATLQQGLARLFPEAHLEPATFQEWIEQQAN